MRRVRRSYGIRWARALLLVGLAGTGCGDDTGDTDAGADSSTGDAGPSIADAGPPSRSTLPSGAELATPAAPGAPAPPSLECTRGWRALPAGVEGGAAACDPWPEGGRADCEGASAHRPGEPGCAPVGAACDDATPYARDLPEAVAVHVLAGAPPGGDGSPAAPLSTLAEAVARAGPGDVIALGEGTYAEAVSVPPGVTVWGACAERTRIEGPDAGESEAAVTLGGGAALRNLTIAGARGGIEVRAPGAVVEGVVVDGTAGAGVAVRGGELEATDLLVRATRPHPVDFEQDAGVRVDAGGLAVLSRASIDSPQTLGVSARGEGSRITFRDGVIRDTRLGASMRGGRGVDARDGARIVLDHAAVEDNRFAAVLAMEGAAVDLLDSVVRGTMATRGGGGVGLLADDGGTVTATRALLERNTSIAVQSEAGSLVELDDVVVRDTQPIPLDLPNGGLLGSGLGVNDAVMTARRVSVEGSTNAGIIVGGSGGRFEASDLTVLASSHSPGDLASGESIFVNTGAEAILTRALLRGAEQHNVWVYGASATFTDVTVQDTERRASDNARGFGIRLIEGSRLTVERVLVERSVEIGVVAVGGSTLEGTDLTVRDTRPATARFATHLAGFGVGLWSDTGARVDLERVHVEGSRAVASFAGAAGTTVRLRDARLTATESWATPTIDGTLLGIGLVVQRGGAVEIERGLIDDNRGMGVQVVAAALALRDAIIRDTRPDEYDEVGGLGMQISDGRVTGSLLRVEGNRHFGISAYGETTAVLLEDLAVIETGANLCQSDGRCPDLVGGVGLGVYRGAHVEVSYFRVATSALCGVQIASDGQLDLSNGEVSGSPVGVNVQVPGYDLSRLTDGVEYRDNDQNLDAASLPIPSPRGLVDGAAAED